MWHDRKDDRMGIKNAGEDWKENKRSLVVIPPFIYMQDFPLINKICGGMVLMLVVFQSNPLLLTTTLLLQKPKYLSIYLAIYLSPLLSGHLLYFRLSSLSHSCRVGKAQVKLSLCTPSGLSQNEIQCDGFSFNMTELATHPHKHTPHDEQYVLLYTFEKETTQSGVECCHAM